MKSIETELSSGSFIVPDNLRTCKIYKPPEANWRIYFGDSDPAYSTYFQFYLQKPPNRFQRWLIHKTLGIRWENIEQCKTYYEKQ